MTPIATDLYNRARPALSHAWSIPHLRRFIEPLAAFVRRDYRREFFDTGEYDTYASTFDRHWQEIGSNPDLGDISKRNARDYYGLVRALEPTNVVETGVANGLSTLAILLALDDNDHGRLHSVDLPHHADDDRDHYDPTETDGSKIPADCDPGWIIPSDLKRRWRLHTGKSQTELPRLRTEIDTIDLFVHDSMHSESVMLYEYELAWNWLNDDGLLLSDDINWNSAFRTFHREHDTRVGYLGPNVGYATRETNEGGADV